MCRAREPIFSGRSLYMDSSATWNSPCVSGRSWLQGAMANFLKELLTADADIPYAQSGASFSIWWIRGCYNHYCQSMHRHRWTETYQSETVETPENFILFRGIPVKILWLFFVMSCTICWCFLMTPQVSFDSILTFAKYAMLRVVSV